MKDIKVNQMELSQFHAGQMVDLSASVIRDHEGVWYSIRGKNDRSTQKGWQYEVATHATQAEAEAAASEGLVVSCDNWTSYELAQAKKIERFCEKEGQSFGIAIKPTERKAEIAIAGESRVVDFSDINAACQRLLWDACQDIRFGRYEGDEFILDVGKTAAFHSRLKAVI